MSSKVREIEPGVTERLARVRLVIFDFDGVFTDNTVYVSQDGTESVRCWRGDGLGLAKLRAAAIETAIVSTETNPVVSARSRKLSLRCVQGCDDKLSAIQTLAGELGISLADTAFVGNDINDLECLKAVGLPIVVHDAHPDVRDLAAYRTHEKGGQGAVREVCDAIVAAQQRQTA